MKNLIGNGLNLRTVVCGDDDGSVLGAVHSGEEVDDRRPRVRIEIAGRLVGQQEGRIAHESPGRGHALLLAPGQGSRSVLQAVGQAHPVQNGSGALLPLGGGNARKKQRKGHILPSRHGGHEVKLLKHQPHHRPPILRPARRGKLPKPPLSDLNRAGRGPIQRGKHMEERRLPRPARSCNAHERAARKGQ